MPRVVCPVCQTGFEGNISRDNFALNCVSCGVAFNAAGFLSREDFQAAAKSIGRGSGSRHSRQEAGGSRQEAGGSRQLAVGKESPGTDPATQTPAAQTAGLPPDPAEAAQPVFAEPASNATRTCGLPFMHEPDETAGRDARPTTEPDARPTGDLQSIVDDVQRMKSGHAPKSAEKPGAPREADRQPERASPPADPIPPAPPAPSAPSPASPVKVRSGRRPLLEGNFGPYEIQGEIARGGVGAVFRARHRVSGKILALKVLLEGADAGDSERERFQHECETAKALSLPGMVQVFDVGELEGRPYMAMELIEGRSLDRVIPEKSLSVNDCLVLMKSVAETIGALHEAGYVHRDIKPGNILIDAFGSPKVADFGLVKSLDEITRLTASGLVCGTPAYMAPEQARGDGQAVDPRSDVWALGAVLYEMLTGKPPFQAENALRLMLRITKDPPVPPRSLNLKVPQDVHCIVMKCLEKRPEKRYPNARSLAGDIARFLNGEPLNAASQHKVQQLFNKAAGRGRILAGAGAAFAVLLAAVLLARAALLSGDVPAMAQSGYAVLADRSLGNTERLDKAERLFREALAASASDGRAQLGLGLCLACRAIDQKNQRVVDAQKFNEALAATQQAALRDPRLAPEAFAQSARFYMWLKQHSLEARQLEQALAAAPSNLRYRESLALAYWNAGASDAREANKYYNSAVREFQNILDADPAYPRVREYKKQLQERFLAQVGATARVSASGGRR